MYTSFPLKLVPFGLKLLAVVAFFLFGTLAILALTRLEPDSLHGLRESDRTIKHSEDQSILLEKQTKTVRQRNALRMTIVHDVMAGKISKEVAAQRFLEMNRSEPIVLNTLRASYHSSDDMVCASRQLDQYVSVVTEHLKERRNRSLTEDLVRD